MGSLHREADVDSPAFFLAREGGLCGFMRCRHGLTPVYMSGLSGNTVQWACATVMQLNYGFLVCVGFRRAGQRVECESKGITRCGVQAQEFINATILSDFCKFIELPVRAFFRNFTFFFEI